MKIKCRNLKIRIILKHRFDSTKQTTKFKIESKRNLLIVRGSFTKCVFIIYKHTLSTIHVTGIRNKDSINDIAKFLEEFQLYEIRKLIVDNSLFTGSVVNPIELTKIKGRLDSKYNFYSVRFSEDVFPAVFIRPSSEMRLDYATILLFKNSKFVIIESKSLKNIRNTLEVVKHLTR